MLDTAMLKLGDGQSSDQNEEQEELQLDYTMVGEDFQALLFVTRLSLSKRQLLHASMMTSLELIAFFMAISTWVWGAFQQVRASDSANIPSEYSDDGLPVGIYFIATFVSVCIFISTCFLRTLLSFGRISATDQSSEEFKKAVKASNQARKVFRRFNATFLVTGSISLLVRQIGVAHLGRWTTYDANLFNDTVLTVQNETTCGGMYPAFFEDYTRRALCPVGETAIYSNSTILSVGSKCVDVIDGYCTKESDMYLYVMGIYGLATVFFIVTLYAAEQYRKKLHRADVIGCQQNPNNFEADVEQQAEEFRPQ